MSAKTLLLVVGLLSSTANAQSESADPNGVTGGMDMTSTAMEAAITDLMLGKSAFGATPMGGSIKTIENLLTKTMMPKVKAAHKSDQDNLNTLVEEIKKCGSTKRGAIAAAKPSLTSYKSASSSHQSCRAKEAVAYTSKEACLGQQRSLYNEKVLRCNFFATVGRNLGTTKANTAIMKKAGSEKTEGYITRLSKTLCGTHNHGTKGNTIAKGGWGGGLPNSYLERYLKAKEKCEQAKKSYNKKVIECTAKKKAYNVKKGQCDQYQRTMDGDSCKHAVMLKDLCESYAGCYTDKKKSYEVVKAKVINEEKDRKAEWRGLKRMECLVKSFADGKVTDAEVNACKKKSHSTTHLNIKYPPVPPLETCTVPTLYPATGAYKRREFDALPTLAKGLTSALCTGVVSISTTPRKGSPSNAKCTRIALVGHYSAGGIVKCTNGLDVYKSTQTNSCPTGTKIFSPASRADWKTFLGSAGPLRHPNWIIDVTRPKNSCGGCKNNPMNSKNKAQKTWTTSDGSPWWLRSTTYTEPSGDYHANCYLHLSHTPANENSVTFNDGSCSYHSRSYYCQPIDISLKPNSGSPASCKCSKIETTSKYTPGYLIKCEQCLDVYKSTQKNSCPKGMKIFSPQSRQDWKVFLSSGGPLRAPHWIIDVTRPQNSCGGCTKYPMSGKTPQQATWRTSDGSPWWLRSTVYSEPNGDYKPNCFLNLGNPTSEDTITFTDHNCNYHSRSYYCQYKKSHKNYAGFKPSKKPVPPPPPPAKPKPAMNFQAMTCKDRKVVCVLPSKGASRPAKGLTYWDSNYLHTGRKRYKDKKCGIYYVQQKTGEWRLTLNGQKNPAACGGKGEVTDDYKALSCAKRAKLCQRRKGDHAGLRIWDSNYLRTNLQRWKDTKCNIYWVYQNDGTLRITENNIRSPQPCGSHGLLPIGKVVALHSKSHNKFVRMNGKSDMDTAGTKDINQLPKDWNWERFVVVDAGGGEIALHNAAHNKFIRMSNRHDMYASSTKNINQLPKAWTWERFKVVDAGGGEIALHSKIHNRFVRMNKNGKMDASDSKAAKDLPAANVWGWERFRVVVTN